MTAVAVVAAAGVAARAVAAAPKVGFAAAAVWE